MTPDPRGPVQIVQQGTDYFRRWRPGCDSDSLYLRAGETNWHGPYPSHSDGMKEQRHEHRLAVKNAAKAGKAGIPLHVQLVGAFIRTRRLPEGPAKKLSDWCQLPPGVAILLNPHATAEDVECARGRAERLRYGGRGCFRTWTDNGGALWVAREGDAP